MKHRLFSIVMALSVGLAGCDTSGGGGVKASRKVNVLVAVYPEVEMVRAVGGAEVGVEWLVESPGRAEAVETTAELVQRANKADLVMTAGPWDRWAGEEQSDESKNARLIRPYRMSRAPVADERAYGWLDPVVMEEMARALKTQLAVLTPERASVLEQRYGEYRAQIEKVDGELKSGLLRFAGRKMLVARPVWGAFCARYGLVQVTPVEGPEEKLSAEDLKTIARVAGEQGCKVIFVDVSTAAGVRQRIEEKTGLRTVTIDAVGTSAPEGRSGYGKLMGYNLEQIGAGLGGGG